MPVADVKPLSSWSEGSDVGQRAVLFSSGSVSTRRTKGFQRSQPASLSPVCRLKRCRRTHFNLHVLRFALMPVTKAVVIWSEISSFSVKMRAPPMTAHIKNGTVELSIKGKRESECWCHLVAERSIYHHTIQTDSFAPGPSGWFTVAQTHSPFIQDEQQTYSVNVRWGLQASSLCFTALMYVSVKSRPRGPWQLQVQRLPTVWCYNRKILAHFHRADCLCRQMWCASRGL